MLSRILFSISLFALLVKVRHKMSSSVNPSLRSLAYFSAKRKVFPVPGLAVTRTFPSWLRAFCFSESNCTLCLFSLLSLFIFFTYFLFSACFPFFFYSFFSLISSFCLFSLLSSSILTSLILFLFCFPVAAFVRPDAFEQIFLF